jgi:hypothetical protein
MGWSSASMAGRYQHMTAPVRRAIADQVGGHLWEQAEGRDQSEEPPIAESDSRRRHSCRFCLATYSNVIHTERCEQEHHRTNDD